MKYFRLIIPEENVKNLFVSLAAEMRLSFAGENACQAPMGSKTAGVAGGFDDSMMRLMFGRRS